MTENAREQEILALLKTIRKEAYEEGWRDAVRAIMKAVAEAVPDANSRAAEWVSHYGESKSPETPAASDRAPWGLTIRATEAALDRTGDRGIDLDTVRAMARELEGHDLAESSVRSTLLNMERTGKVTRRGNRWYRVLSEKTEAAGSAQQANPADPFFKNQGGSDERTALAH